MATLYELIPAYKNVMEQMELDPENASALVDTLESINCALEVKVDGYCKMMAMLNDTAGMKAEAKRLAQRAKAQENLANSLKERLQYAMELIGKDKIKTELFTVSLQNHKGSIDVHTPELLPEQFKKTTISVDYDKTAIYNAITAGEVVPGACIMANRGVVIR